MISWRRLDTAGASPGSREGHAAAASNHTMFVFGGKQVGGYLAPHMYSLHESGLWKVNALSNPTPTVRSDHTMVYLPPRAPHTMGRVLLFGGQKYPTLYGDLWQYDVATSTWRCLEEEPGSNGPCARQGHAAAVHGGDMYVFGGWSGDGGHIGDLWRYRNDTWERMEADKPPQARARHGMVVIGDTLLVHGGWSGEKTLSAIWAYHIPTNVWRCIEEQGRGPGAISLHGLAAYEGNAYCYRSDEYSEDDAHELYKFDLARETWSEVQVDTTSPQHRNHTFVTVGDRICLYGGAGGRNGARVMFLDMAIMKGWSPERHLRYTRAFRAAVFTVLCLREKGNPAFVLNRKSHIFAGEANSSATTITKPVCWDMLPIEVLFYFFDIFMRHWEA